MERRERNSGPGSAVASFTLSSVTASSPQSHDLDQRPGWQRRKSTSSRPMAGSLASGSFSSPSNSDGTSLFVCPEHSTTAAYPAARQALNQLQVVLSCDGGRLPSRMGGRLLPDCIPMSDAVFSVRPRACTTTCR
jgi:hypothetical protein